MRLGKYIALFVMFFCAAATFAAASPILPPSTDTSANAKTVVTDDNCRQGRFTKRLSDTLYIYFRVGKTNVVPSFMGNSTTLNTFDRFLTEYTDPRFDFTLNGITLQGSASPEGKVHWNKILANRRADAIAKYIKMNIL